MGIWHQFWRIIFFFNLTWSCKRQNLIGYHFWLKVKKAPLKWSITSWFYNTVPSGLLVKRYKADTPFTTHNSLTVCVTTTQAVNSMSPSQGALHMWNGAPRTYKVITVVASFVVFCGGYCGRQVAAYGAWYQASLSA